MRSRRGLGREAYAYWQKHGFDKKLRAELNWEADEYRKYEEEQRKKQLAGTDTCGKQPRKQIATKAARKANPNHPPAGIKKHTDTGLVQCHFMKSATTRKAQNF